ncbi:folylpolyglutamate synthase, putative [Coccidioides posadasii C735 delta SOWgp]|uniref:Dihydrofolate synthetase n=1 Tax=Coccidioides posadasii (strain C735) TaxID=222929 RepID=C5P8S2_COCP7|nr:folylpolyglutamate synthase, putative [Coccidioides posadasii C735 delta SOWgp]EER26134.1 folylpolyglutamate synthase, putative [Coccidioides posadasii C735 delta SOWgp]|eukprot:XP_003068279.1 folylpolyglutamate synthase, putative [Coccidioides posadasii C735 delta SOWgp]
MIELGLSRITQLVQKPSLTWKAIHVAGTNGKGSITGYLSALLTAGGVRCGSFTSPHLIDRWDCITINERAVQESIFRRIENEVKQRNQRLGLGATEFELLTATAFEIFSQEQVEVGVVEVGMGGRLDATNILTNVLVSIISKIGYDHQAILGNTIEEIAREKAGIVKPGVPCVVDSTNSHEVKQVIQAHAETLDAPTAFVNAQHVGQLFPLLRDKFGSLDLPPHQRANLSCAITALQVALPQIRPDLMVDQLFPFISKTPRPGRLQEVCLETLISRNEPVLLDGAHNPQSAEVLASYVDRKFRAHAKTITWVVAASQGKDIVELLGCMLKPGDNVAVVEFGPVAGMPWVRSVRSTELATAARDVPGIGAVEGFERDVLAGLNWANTISAGGPVVIAGSLYLVSDVLRLLREAQAGIARDAVN